MTVHSDWWERTESVANSYEMKSGKIPIMQNLNSVLNSTWSADMKVNVSTVKALQEKLHCVCVFVSMLGWHFITQRQNAKYCLTWSAVRPSLTIIPSLNLSSSSCHVTIRELTVEDFQAHLWISHTCSTLTVCSDFQWLPRLLLSSNFRWWSLSLCWARKLSLCQSVFFCQSDYLIQYAT